MNSPARPLEALQAISLSRLAEVGYRRRRSIFLILASTVIATGAWVFLIRGDTYIAESKLLVMLGQEQAPLPTMIGGDKALVASQPSYVNSEIEILRSRDLIERLIDQVDLTDRDPAPPTSLFGWIKQQVRMTWHAVRDEVSELAIAAGLKARLSPREQTIEALSHALVVDSLPNSFIVVARMGWSSRGVAAPILNSLIKLYLNSRANLFQGATAEVFFRQRRQEAATKLGRMEDKLAAFEREKGITNPDEQMSSLQKRLAEAASGVDAARIELKRVDTALRQIGTDGPSEASSFAAADLPMAQGIASSLAALGARSAGLETTLNNRSTTVRQQRAEFAALSQTVSNQVQAMNETWQEQFTLRKRIRDEINEELTRLHHASQRWQDLKREISLAVRALEYNDNKLNEATGVAALESARIGNVIVVQQPAEHATPAGVRKSTLLLLAITAGLVFAAAWASIREFFDHRVYCAADAEYLLGMPVLASLPRDRGRRGEG